MVDKIAKKVSEEPMENVDEGNYEYMPKTEGVTAVKKDYCENIDGRLGFECTATIVGSYQLDMDHIDGDHYHNVPENIQTICKNCHAVKSRENKDHLNFMKNEEFQNRLVKKVENQFYELRNELEECKLLFT